MSNFVVLEPEKKIKSFFFNLSFVSCLGKYEPFSIIYRDFAVNKTEVKADIAHGSIELIILNYFQEFFPIYARLNCLWSDVFKHFLSN